MNQTEGAEPVIIEQLKYIISGQTVYVPLAWSHVTVGQFMRMRKLPAGSNVSHYLEIFTGISRDTWGREDYDSLEDVISCMSFLAELPDFKTFVMPEKYSIGGKELEIPKDIKLKSLDQRINFEQFCMPPVNESGDVLNVLDMAIAFYIQPIYEDKPFSQAIEPTMEAVRGTLLCEAYPIAAFFLRKYVMSLTVKQRS